MCHNQQLIGCFQIREDHTFPVRHDAFDCIFQRLGTGQFRIGHFIITCFKARITRVILSQCMRSNIIATTPDQHLLFTIFGSSFRLIQTLKLSIMLLVQAPRFLYRYPVLIHTIQYHIQCFHCTFQVGSIGFIKLEVIIYQ